jgi:Homeodomain-like domain
MPRESPFSIVLSKEERTILETQVRQYTSPYCDVIRAKIVLLAAQGFSNDVIAARLDTPRQIVSKWRERFALARLPGLEAQPRGGRPAHFSPGRRLPGEKLSPVSSPIDCSCRCRDSLFPRYDVKRSPKHWWRRPAGQPCGAGSAPMHSALDDIAVESFHATRISRPKPGASSICMLGVFGRCEPKSGMAPADRLIHEVMSQEPYKSADASSGSWKLLGSSRPTSSRPAPPSMAQPVPTYAGPCQLAQSN